VDGDVLFTSHSVVPAFLGSRGHAFSSSPPPQISYFCYNSSFLWRSLFSVPESGVHAEFFAAFPVLFPGFSSPALTPPFEGRSPPKSADPVIPFGRPSFSLSSRPFTSVRSRKLVSEDAPSLQSRDYDLVYSESWMAPAFPRRSYFTTACFSRLSRICSSVSLNAERWQYTL